MEQETRGVPISSIHINLAERSITLEAENEAVAKLIFSSGTIYFNPPKEALEEQVQSQESPEQENEPELELSLEREKTVTFTGRLKGKPRQGKADRSGHPTAYARFAAHEEGREGAHIFLATFHRGAANIALNLSKEAQVTVEGYHHHSDDAKRMDTLSVVRFVRYPSGGHRR